ncbi:MAG TPA: APC family permease [Bryobacteraceae bacterium]|nr:APC family permease [Bryobacteraceae bacterium]
MPLVDKLLGRPLASSEAKSERIGPAAGVPTFGLDALSSAAYGPEAALTILLPLGALGLGYIMPITAAIVVLLAIVYFSYRQTIAAYPGGGGSYTVAHENLGDYAGLLAAAALATDYVLNVAVGISAGVGALISAAPALQPHTLGLCLGILALLTVVNLRGVREAGLVFMAPTYLFVASLVSIIGWGVWLTLASGGRLHPAVAPPAMKPVAEAASIWIVLRAFASGCTAMTGVEAVSNGVQAFREPVVDNARRTLTIIIAILIVLLLGIAWLVQVYHIGATQPGSAQYQSILSQLIGAVAGRGAVYWIAISSILMVLCLSANTSFADFPRLCRAVAENSFLPHSFANRGRRLVYTEGIWVLAVLSGVIITAFGGVTDRLIPLFAVGAFLAFTMSQAGMVAHWRKQRERRHIGSMFINGLGALATAATVVVVILAKFVEGAWMVVLLVPALMAVMFAVRRHYDRDAVQTQGPQCISTKGLKPPLVVVPVENWTKVSEKALRFALTLSRDVIALHIECGEQTKSLRQEWPACVEQPAEKAGLGAPKLVVLKSPFRFVIQPIVDHVLKLEHEHADRTIAVVLPELIERRWYEYFLHNQRGKLLAALLLLQGDRRIVIVNVPWYLT